jgi:hypothetical protein
MISRLTSKLPSLGLSQLGKLPRFNYKYDGKPVGLKTSGNYGELPIPCPAYFTLTKGPIDSFFFSVKALSALAFLSCCFGPILLLPFWSKHKSYLREAAEKYGPTRYGQGQKDIL